MNKFKNYLGIARKAGYLQIGEESTGFASRAGKARLIMLASDASDNAKRRAEGFARNTFLVILPLTKDELAYTLGKNGCSMIAVTDIGLAAKFAAELNSAFPCDEYLKMSEILEAKNKKALKRRKEARISDKNKRVGRKKQ